jgi:hypothetical protein
MKLTKLERLIESRRESAAAAAAAAGTSTLETILEALFTEQFAAEALQAARQRFTSAPPPVAPAVPPSEKGVALPPEQAASPGAGTFDGAGFYESLRVRLLDAQSIAPAELAELAAARAATILTTLTKSGAVASGRTAALESKPVSRRKAGSARVPSELTMSAEPVSPDDRGTQ